MVRYFSLTHTHRHSGSPCEYASQERKGSNVALTLYVMVLTSELQNGFCYKLIKPR